MSQAGTAGQPGPSTTDGPHSRDDAIEVSTRTAAEALRRGVASLYAGCSLKSDPDEGGLTDQQAAQVRGWKRGLISAGVRQLAELARVCHGAPAAAPRAAFALRPCSAELLTELSGVDGADGAPGDPLPPVSAALLAWSTGDRPVSTVDQIAAEFAAATGDARRLGVAFEPVRGPTGTGPAEYGPALDALLAVAWDTALGVLTGILPTPVPAPGAATLATRLVCSVVRPLAEARSRLSTGDTAVAAPVPGVPEALADRIWWLAREATRLRVSPRAPQELVEAAAAVQDLALRIAPDRLAELREWQAGLTPGITCALNGPYLVTNVDTITDHLGVTYPVPPQVALCRCGASATKPFCDGAHARIDFTVGKDPKRVPDRRDSYRGLQLTVLDNRGLCAHSGFCTDRLSTVFHAGSEPFVTPSGGRLDDIVRAVRSCPSGALSYAINGVEAREQVDQDRPPAIEVSKDGPYRVTGGIPLSGPDGAPEPRNAGASLEHYSLCRCGQSQNKPFCSGMHWYVNFTDPPMPDNPNLFQWAGGLPALLRMTRLFYAKYVPEEPLLAPLFANMSPDHPERVAAWLGEVFGGPKTYSQEYGGYPRMISQHLGKGITEPMRARWAALIQRAADDAGLPADPEFRAAFVAYIEWGSRIAVENSSSGAQPPEGLPVPRWWWVCEATPGARESALAPPSEQPAPPVLPADDEPVSFAAHIKTLFRARDRNSMRFAFDLWSYEDVCQHGPAILARVRAGTMPCDGAWPQEWIDVLQRWLDSGAPA